MNKPLFICAIPGVNPYIYSHTRMWKNFETAFLHAYPHATFVLEKIDYLPWYKHRLAHYMKSILEKYDTGEHTLILLGHSMGGIIATELAAQFKHSKVSTLITVFSPHTSFGKKILRIPKTKNGETSYKVISCGARFDQYVWWGSKHPQAHEHLTLNCDHSFGLRFKQFAEQIAEASVR